MRCKILFHKIELLNPQTGISDLRDLIRIIRSDHLSARVGYLSGNAPNQVASKVKAKGRQVREITDFPKGNCLSRFDLFSGTIARFFGTSSGNTLISSGSVRESFGKRALSSGNFRRWPKPFRRIAGKRRVLFRMILPLVCRLSFISLPPGWEHTLKFRVL